jgi:outer membrane lipoprotein-sorting protein
MQEIQNSKFKIQNSKFKIQNSKFKIIFPMRKIVLLLFSFHFSVFTFSQDMTSLVMKVKAKLDQVNDYEADGRMKTDVAFIKAPIGKVKIFYKKPNKFRLKKDGGISLLPKGGVSVNMNSIFSMTDFVALAAGEAIVGGVKTKIVKLLPSNENSDVVLTTMYIDEANLLVKKAVTTTKENGTYEIEMSYGAFALYGLPDKVVFGFNTKDYKLPKGITLEFDDNEKPVSETEKIKNKKGRVEIVYTNYIINKGIADAVFK